MTYQTPWILLISVLICGAATIRERRLYIQEQYTFLSAPAWVRLQSIVRYWHSFSLHNLRIVQANPRIACAKVESEVCANSPRIIRT